ncbi:bacteriocin [Clostridium puniceum]|uniref:Bacteriocin n=1 Tax=Clostridium puniceum TaxID=29367 RepID=A0A1S8TVJ2_9CLOT|nr:lactococcin 972 family bacteriocin [Clostridium puniceum]OOM81807.1 bacteriocin [Clostridium puniceum]
MKKILSVLTVLTVLSVPTISAYASTEHVASHSGSATLVRNSGITLKTPVSGDPFFESKTTVSGGTFHESGSVVEGGDWYYGFSGSNLFSQYDNDEVTHKSSVKNSNTTKTSGWVQPGKTAYSSTAQTWTGNQCFWGTW